MLNLSLVPTVTSQNNCLTSVTLSIEQAFCDISKYLEGLSFEIDKA